MFGELLDWVATIKQDAFVSIDERDSALAASCCCETWVVGKQTSFLVQASYVHDIRAMSWADSWQ